jgi:hypothetical protein
VSTKTRSALRATLKQEDAALEERLPEASPPPTTQPETAAPAATADTSVTPATAETGTQPPVASASAAPAPAVPTVPAKTAAQAKPEKRKHERFKLAASDRRRLGTLGDELKAVGRRPSKSELVRAGLAALAAQGVAEVKELVDTLSPAARAKDKKARRKKEKKAGSKGKGKSTSKKR